MENSKKILIAEDDSFLASAYKVKFEKDGYTVRIAENGTVAEKLIKEEKPDVMLLDLMMPGKDGFTVLEDIKGDNSLAGFPVIVASNLGQEEDIKKAMDLGAKDYVIKSNMSLTSIIEKIETFIK